jgi:hypothetical protein
LTLDPANGLSVSTNKVSRLALDFKLAASNVVSSSSGTVTVTPLIVASASPTDSKNVRVRGPLVSTDITNTRYTVGVTPFDFPTGETGRLKISPTDVTTYEINGTAWTGKMGLTALAGLSSDAMTVTVGTMTSSSTYAATHYAATQVLAGSSVQSSSLDRVSGIVSARSGNSLTVEDATLISIEGTNTFMSGTATVKVGASTLVTVLGQGSTGNTPSRRYRWDR